MDLRRAKKAVREVARRNGVPEQRVVADIEAAIADAVANARRTKDEAALAEWEKIPCKGCVPTAYELIAYVAGKLDEQTPAEKKTGFSV